MTVRIEAGDMREVLKRLIAEGVKVDSVVCDPPYHLTSIVKRFGADGAAPAKVGKTGAYARASAGFMGQKWDGGDIAFQPETWRLCYDLLPPGGHLLAFSGTRTYHRMACAIEDAGFEVRDCISWNYGAGFPKSHNVGKKLDAAEKRCACAVPLPIVRSNVETKDALSGGAQQDVLGGLQREVDLRAEDGGDQEAANQLRPVRRGGERSAADETEETSGGLLQPVMSGKSARGPSSAICRKRQRKDATEQGLQGREEPGMEGRGDAPPTPRQLRERAVRAVPAGPNDNGEARRLCDGASPRDGAVDRPAVAESGNGAPHRSSTVEQPERQPGIVAEQPEPQTRGAWPVCGRCGKPVVPDGLGTALKPAMELICLARKPLDGTVAANVLEHGTGALNIDGCRIETSEDLNGGTYTPGAQETNAEQWRMKNGRAGEFKQPSGRWPANVVHDGSEEVVAAFPEQTSGGTPPSRPRDKTRHTYGAFGGQDNLSGIGSTSGNASRFFYSAKADADDRLGSKHPTVKPVDLMRWLVRLVTPKGGHVLDPFAGSGTTGMACMAEGFDCTLVEREAEYLTDIRRRIAHVRGDDTPLFNPEAA
jgi:DNA modification methylase